MINGLADHTRISRLQLSCTGNYGNLYPGSPWTGWVDSCIFWGRADNIANGKVTNSLFIDDHLDISGSAVVHSCTFIRDYDAAPASTAITLGYPTPGPLIRSCAFFGWSSVYGYSPYEELDANCGYNATDLASGLPGSTGNHHNVIYSAGGPFVDAAGLNDLRPVVGSSLFQNGYLDTTNAPNDITGLARGTSPTIGAWEVFGTIAFGGFANTASPGYKSTTSNDTISFTCTGNNRALLVFQTWDNNHDTTDHANGVTYNGVSMTKLLGPVQDGGDRLLYLYYLMNPDSGTHDVVVTANATIYLSVTAIALYTGVGSIETANAGSVIVNGVGANTIAGTITTVANNAWVVAGTLENVPPVYADANTTVRGTALFVDTGAPITPPGARTLRVYANSAYQFSLLMTALAPVESAAFSYPISDYSDGLWTASSGSDLYAMIDEVSVDDADYITSNTTPSNDACSMKLGPLHTPPAGDVVLTIRHKAL
jgi:hypothetical protein